MLDQGQKNDNLNCRTKLVQPTEVRVIQKRIGAELGQPATGVSKKGRPGSGFLNLKAKRKPLLRYLGDVS